MRQDTKIKSTKVDQQQNDEKNLVYLQKPKNRSTKNEWTELLRWGHIKQVQQSHVTTMKNSFKQNHHKRTNNLKINATNVVNKVTRPGDPGNALSMMITSWKKQIHRLPERKILVQQLKNRYFNRDKNTIMIIHSVI